jgi:hypothetical protein
MSPYGIRLQMQSGPLRALLSAPPCRLRGGQGNLIHDHEVDGLGPRSLYWCGPKDHDPCRSHP